MSNDFGLKAIEDKNIRQMHPASQILIITGGRGTGKTTLCQRWVDAARASGWQVAGVLSPARLEGGQKTGIDVVDLGSGERRNLARLAADAPVNAGGEDGGRAGRPYPYGDVGAQAEGISVQAGGVRTKKWVFDAEALSWGSRVLANAVPCDLLVVDELGPIEFERNEGWVEGIAAIDSGKYHLALVVIRPELLAAARQRWESAAVYTVGSDVGTLFT